MKKKKNQKTGITAGTIVALVISSMALVLAFILLLIYWRPRAQREDYERIASTEYDTVFLSMFPLDTYREEDYALLRARKIMIVSYRIPLLSGMESYMQEIAESGNKVTTAYLGIRPDLTDPEDLRDFVNRYSHIDFEILIANPSADYWRRLPQEAYEATLAAYTDMLTAIPRIPDANFCFMSSEEWLINNPANYIDEWLLSEDAAGTVMAYSYTSPRYLVEDAESAVRSLEEVTRKLRVEPEGFPDLSDVCVQFFGDSVIANYTDSMSVPGVVNGLSGACVYNLGYGGNSAARGAEDRIALPDILEAFFQGDLSELPSDEPVYEGIASYLENPPEGKKQCFVINYGLNDYFKGYAISSEDSYDVYTYCGAIRAAVKTIRENAPDAQIILCTPNFITECEAGAEPHGPGGSVLADYVAAEIGLARELKVDLLDNYHELGITAENSDLYLDDKVHPSLACRYLIGKRLCGAIR